MVGDITHLGDLTHGGVGVVCGMVGDGEGWEPCNMSGALIVLLVGTVVGDGTHV